MTYAHDHRATTMVDRRKSEMYVEVWYDQEMWDLEDACGDGFTFVTGNRRSTHYVPEFDPDDYPDVEQWFPLDVYEHGQVLFSVSGEGPQCRWDTAQGGAAIGLHRDAGWGEDKDKIVRGIASSITAWANGWCYGFTIQDGTGEFVDSLGGIWAVDSDYLAETVMESIPDGAKIVKVTGDADGMVTFDADEGTVS